MKTIYVFIDKLVSEPDAWETHVASLLQGYIESVGIDSEYSVVETSDLADLKLKFQTKVITVKDKFIFPNAWTSATVYVRHWSEIYQIPVKSYGFWTRGCYINEDEEYRPLNDRNWRKVFERSSYRSLTKSFFINEYFKEQFRIYVSKNVFPERLNIMSFPLDYLNFELLPYREAHYKQNIITFPWSSYTVLQEQIVYDFIRVFPKYQIIFAQERKPLERNQLLAQIAKSKLAFLPYKSPNIGKEIYECLILDTIPLVPDLELFRQLVPEEFRYPPEWTDTIFNYCRYAPELIEKINDLILNYESYKPLMVEHTNKLSEKMYDSVYILNEIFDNYKKN